MAGSKTRSEYYWLSGRVVRRRADRPTGFGPWPRQRRRDRLIATIESTDDGMQVEHGPAYSSERLVDAIMLENDLPPADVVPGLDARLPPSLVREFEERVEAATNEITRRFRRLNSEDRMTGALFDRLEGTLSGRGWRVEITAHHYSSVVKENRIGADAGVIIDIQAESGGRLYKSILIQAKRSLDAPGGVDELPRVPDQRRLMREYTDSGYVWVYTPDGVVAYGPESTREPLTADAVMADALRCTRGDRSRRAIANALDGKHVLEVLVSS